jgi:hypothetical protein
MKKAKSELNDWGRPEYKRSDFGEIVRGKYAKRIRESTNIVVLDPEVAKAFPNAEAVNKALRGLISPNPSAGNSKPKSQTKKTSKKSKQ